MKDTLYRSNDEPVKPFEFNQRVVDVFPDMIERSVPGYPLTISMIGVMADEYVQERTNVYDLGCSLGGVSLAIQQGLKNKQCNIVAVDNSQAMIDSCVETIPNEGQNIEFRLQNVLDTEISHASVVVMNFTLQFIPLESRKSLIKKIYDGLLPGGVLILSEKVMFDNETENETMNHLHHHMKELNGYDKLEIASKREALDDVLIPESIETHMDRVNDSGFDSAFIWLKCFNFISLIAIK
ncbi:MAG: tRNA (cmo5U34)-methyltransferase [Gammaproteobacteria bacterium]|jgi:tRNA (cmo5U34)-methyltransferase